MIIDFLKLFGDLVHKFDIDFSLVNSVKEIGNLINKNGFESLTNLVMENCERSMFNQWENKFKNLKSLTLSTKELNKFDFNNKDLKFSQFFPKVNKLVFNRIISSDWSLYAEQFEYAKFVELNMYHTDSDNGNDNAKIDEFFTKNSQIQTLKIEQANLKLLTYVSKLPKLKTLDLRALNTKYDNFKGDDIHFKTVKNLRLITLDVVPNGIDFENLDDFNLDIGHNELNDKWIEFIDKKINKKLTRFSLEQDNLIPDQFQAISDKLPDLKNVFISNNVIINQTYASDIEKFMGKTKQLKTLDLIIEMEKSEQNKTTDNLKKGKWHVEITSLDEKKDKISLNIDK